MTLCTRGVLCHERKAVSRNRGGSLIYAVMVVLPLDGFVTLTTALATLALPVVRGFREMRELAASVTDMARPGRIRTTCAQDTLSMRRT